jgi:hypothetical protein
MANIPSNYSGTPLISAGSVTGSFAGFTAVQAATFTSLKDGTGTNLAAGGNIVVAAGATVPLTVTQATISSGTVIFYNT